MTIGRPTRAARMPASAGLLAAALLLAAFLPGGAPARAAAQADRLGGPLSDFWARVKRDWNLRLEGLNRGSLQTAIWVALVWDGPDELPIDRLADTLQAREARRWVRAQITKHRGRDITRRDELRKQALRQHLILVGTPWDNPLIGRALARSPLRVEQGRVIAGDRTLTGDGLTVIAIVPSPLREDRYALIMTGSSASAILDVGDVPYGPTDYVIFRGRRLLERGWFRWRDGAPRELDRQRVQAFSDRFNWRSIESRRYRLHFDPIALSPGRAVTLGSRLDADLDVTASFYGLPGETIEPIDLYLYASIEEKAHQTGDARPGHIERADSSLHAVYGGSIEAVEPALIASALLRRAPGPWGDSMHRELPGFAAALALACRDTFEGISLVEWAVRSGRDTGFLPMDVLLARPLDSPAPGRLDALDAAAFIRSLIVTEGAARVAEFARVARRADFRSVFHRIFGRSLGDSERRWLTALAPGSGGSLARTVVKDSAGLDEPAAEAAQRLRLLFRSGLFAEAAAAASEVLAAAPAGGESELRAWARLTLGRTHAMMGRITAASVELRHDDIGSGPDQVRVIAELWLETLGQPLNRKAAHRILMQEAEADLGNHEWERAERKLAAILASDPANKDAHATLGEVYLSWYQYYHDWLTLDRELFPGISTVDPEMYRYLADNGRRELDLAARLPFGEEDRWLASTGAVETGRDQAVPHFLRGKIQFLKGSLESARREFETALSMEPRRGALAAYCHLYLGRIAILQGDPEAARAQFEAAVKIRATGDVTNLAREELRKLGRAGAP